jgi:Dienelactone hydrolase family
MRLVGDHCFVFEHDGIVHTVFRDGSGPGVLVMHEALGMSDRCLALADRLIVAGFSTYLPLFFGKPGMDNKMVGPALAILCLRRELNSLGTNSPSEIAGWLRALCRRIHAECGGRGVGVIGLCLTGNLVLSVMLEESVLVPVMCETCSSIRTLVEGTQGRSWRARRRCQEGGRTRQSSAGLGIQVRDRSECPDERFQNLEQIFGTCFKAKRIPNGSNNPGKIPEA